MLLRLAGLLRVMYPPGKTIALPSRPRTFTGLVIMTDWIASDPTSFRLSPLFGKTKTVVSHLETRCAMAWDAASILPAWSELRPDVLPLDQSSFAERFALPKQQNRGLFR